MVASTSTPPSSSLADEVRRIQWFHRIKLGEGLVTPGVDDSQSKLQTLHLPDLTGKTVLDVGAWDGFFSFEAERRGAARVLATDSFIWGGSGWGSKRGFDLAKRVLKSHVEEMLIDPMELCPERAGMWDVVLYSGILYHMKHPLLALERAASVTRNLLIVETVLDFMFVRRPAVAFYETSELNQDDTNWSGPNDSAVRHMLHAVGFSRVERVYNRNLLLRAARAAKWCLHGKNPLVTVQQGRATYHAHKA